MVLHSRLVMVVPCAIRSAAETAPGPTSWPVDSGWSACLMDLQAFVRTMAGYWTSDGEGAVRACCRTTLHHEDSLAATHARPGADGSVIPGELPELTDGAHRLLWETDFLHQMASTWESVPQIPSDRWGPTMNGPNQESRAWEQGQGGLGSAFRVYEQESMDAEKSGCKDCGYPG